jgi:hypothetical protein
MNAQFCLFSVAKSNLVNVKPWLCLAWTAVHELMEMHIGIDNDIGGVPSLDVAAL